MDLSERLSIELALQPALAHAPCDLLLSALAAAARSYRRASVCTPFPQTVARTTSGDKCFKTLDDILSQLPSVVVMVEELPALSDASLRLLQWLLLTTRRTLEPFQSVSSIELIQHLKPSPDMELALVRHAPAANAIFLVNSAQGDSTSRSTQSAGERSRDSSYVHGFHGTSFDNLHSILHHGLLNLSGLKMQRNGALFGQGVYLSADFNVAFSFCTAAPAWTSSMIGTRLRVVLVCRVRQDVNTRSSNSRGLPEKYMVVPDPSMVEVQALLIFSDDVLVGITRSGALGSPSGGQPATAEGAHGAAAAADRARQVQQPQQQPLQHGQAHLQPQRGLSVVGRGPRRGRQGHGAQQLCWVLAVVYGAFLVGMWCWRAAWNSHNSFGAAW